MYLNTNSKPEKTCIFGVFIYSWASKHPCSHAHRTKSGENKCTPTDLAIRRWILTLFLRACTQLIFLHSSKLIVFVHAALARSLRRRLLHLGSWFVVEKPHRVHTKVKRKKRVKKNTSLFFLSREKAQFLCERELVGQAASRCPASTPTVSASDHTC